jgi:hypothetical protein
MQRSPNENGAPARSAAISNAIINNADNSLSPTELQERRIARLYLVSMAAASTIAHLAYGVAR